MTREVATVVILAASVTSASAQAPAAVPSPLIARAQVIVGKLVAGDIDGVVETFDARMRAALDAAQLRQFFAGVVTSAGPYKAERSSRSSMQGAITVVVLTSEFERAVVDITVAFNADGTVAGLNFRPAAAAGDYAPAPYADPKTFVERSIVVDAGGWPLPGVLLVPNGDGPFPAVVLVHGSGPSDRDESFGPNRIFRDLAEGLATRGIAVLRYDKRTRTHAARIAAITNFTVKDEALDDAAAAVALLRNDRRIDSRRVFVAGHSMGGMLAPRLGAGPLPPNGLIVLAGAVRSLEQSIVDQMRYLALLDGAISPVEQTSLDEATAFAAAVKQLKPGDPPLKSSISSAPASYLIDLRDYSPPKLAATLSLPMLILQGARDYQVTMADFEEWRKALSTHNNVQFASYPTLNHLFLSGSGPSAPAEYSQPGHVAAAVIDDIATWVLKH